jgi:hypothetical protein
MAPKTLILMTDGKSLRAAGVSYPSTIDGWRWLYKIRRERGLESAFVTVGRRILVDVPAYLAALRTPADQRVAPAPRRIVRAAHATADAVGAMEPREKRKLLPK